MGIATHEISHFSDLTQHSQPDSKSKHDKQTSNHQCEQCISQADVENGLAESTFVFSVNQFVSLPANERYFSFFNLPNCTYSARAPPQAA
ncbi:MAG: hypothetical protein CTY10_04465 [Methylotenera sp.]|nr:MAG: hypothetical protein CTY10_04465 [Methylotenera sp.]